MPLAASNAHVASRTRCVIHDQSVRMVLWKQQPACIIYGCIIASVLCGDEPKTLFLITSLLFGPSSDKRVKAPTRQASTPATEQSAQPAQSAVAQTGHDATARQPRPGHGRRPASSYTGASQVFCSDPDLQPGTSCPDQLCTGTLYDTQRPAIFLRFTGQPVIGATRFDQQVLRCSACLTRYTARLPESVPPEKWDASADVAIAMWKYGCGLPFYRLARASRFRHPTRRLRAMGALC
jgi:hypothetical protein